MLKEPASSIRDQDDLNSLRILAQIPVGIKLNTAGQMRQDMCPNGYFVIYEYPFKIVFKWPYSPLSKMFMLRFDLAPGQLMPQFWRVVQVIERLTKDWESPINVNDLLTAYQVKVDGCHRYSLFFEV